MSKTLSNMVLKKKHNKILLKTMFEQFKEETMIFTVVMLLVIGWLAAD